MSKHWCFTNNNPLPAEFYEVVFAKGKIEYLCYGEEKAPTTDRLHDQGYLCMSKRTRMTAMKKLFKTDFHWEACKGNPVQNKAYCSKDKEAEHFHEWGTLPAGQGTRTDIEKVIDAIQDGATDAELINTHGNTWVKFAGNFQKVKAILLKEVIPKQRPVTVNVLWGPTGTGKTYAAMNTYGDDVFKLNCSNFANGKVWWNGYEGERTLVLDEFLRGTIQFGLLLEVCDVYTQRLEIKNGFTYAQWDTVIITSNYHPDEWYPNVPLVGREALTRRLATGEITELTTKYDASEESDQKETQVSRPPRSFKNDSDRPTRIGDWDCGFLFDD